jgi:hypothetical protein
MAEMVGWEDGDSREALVEMADRLTETPRPVAQGATAERAVIPAVAAAAQEVSRWAS